MSEVDISNVAIHEAAHVVVGWYLGMVPTSTAMGSDGGGPQTEHDRTEYNQSLPGEGLIRGLVNSILSTVQLAAGGCAELQFGVEHEECGWTGDFNQFKPHVEAVSKICGYSYDHCWDFASAMAKEILAEAAIWDAVEAVARTLEARGTLDRDQLAVLLADRGRPRVEQRVGIIVKFVSTPQACALAAAHQDSSPPAG